MSFFPLSKEGAGSLWLASYPRSGNTLLRLILKQAFGLETASISPTETAGWNHVEGMTELVGHYHKDAPNTAARKPALALKTYQLVKTHEAPIDNGPAIYIVRDGRSSVISYYHYLRDIEAIYRSVEEVVAGQHWPGSWSQHFRAWDPLHRPNTLLLRYEELRDSPGTACEKISHFLQRPQLSEFNLTFKELRRLYPKFFRNGEDSRNIAEMNPHLHLFDAAHGETMRELGYY